MALARSFRQIRKMSFEATVSKLRSPVKELVISTTKDSKQIVGLSDVDKQEVLGWIDKTSQPNFINLKVIN